MNFNKNILGLDPLAETDKICAFIKKQVSDLRKDGAVIGISGGVDSALASALCLRALGKSRVLGVILPEKESSPVSAVYANKHAQKMGIDTVSEDITAALEGFGCYAKRDKVIKEIFPEFDQGWTSKLTLPPDLLGKDSLNFYTLIVKDNLGKTKKTRLNIPNLRRILAASNVKQITRMMYLNYYAELHNYLVCGTTNRSEYIQGFFVKYGDGGVDIEPIAHLFKMQIYQLAKHLEVPPEILNRAPSPDTFSFEVTDEEMHFRIPFHVLDLLLYAWEQQIPAGEVATALNLTEEQVKRAFRDIESKHRATEYLRLPALKLEG
jgi:NAD+ synthase